MAALDDRPYRTLLRYVYRSVLTIIDFYGAFCYTVLLYGFTTYENLPVVAPLHASRFHFSCVRDVVGKEMNVQDAPHRRLGDPHMNTGGD